MKFRFCKKIKNFSKWTYCGTNDPNRMLHISQKKTEFAQWSSGRSTTCTLGAGERRSGSKKERRSARQAHTPIPASTLTAMWADTPLSPKRERAAFIPPLEYATLKADSDRVSKSRTATHGGWEADALNSISASCTCWGAATCVHWFPGGR